MAGGALQHLGSSSTFDPSRSDGPSYLNPEEVFEGDFPSPGLDTMEQTTHMADTFYSHVGQQDLIDTAVFPRVSAHTSSSIAYHFLCHSFKDNTSV
jgi:hypothetical protein